MNQLLISAGLLFDGVNAAAAVAPCIEVRDGCIASVHAGKHVQADTRETLHFPSCTILPGLIDTHVHLVFSAGQSNEEVIEQVLGESDGQLFDRAAGNAQAALRAGITTLRDCGGKGTVIQKLRDEIRNGVVAGPDIVSCGVPITTTLGHTHWLGLVADTQEEVQRAAEKMIAEDADWLKVMATGGNMTATSDPMMPQYDNGTLKLIADIGRRAGKHSAAHVLSRSALPGVVAANYRTIEHCDWRVEENRYEFDPALARRIRDQGQFVGLTMSGTTRRAFDPRVAQAATGPVKRLDMRFACERRLLDAGVRFTLHSDAGVRWTPIDSFAVGLRCAEIELKLTPADILKAVTATAAEALELNDRGVLRAGMLADLIVVDGNPLKDLSALERVRAVVKAGKLQQG